jgi:hypothetical protein
VCPPLTLSSGVTTVYAIDHDDAALAGALSVTDNGDGTITDNNTRLMWEKKDMWAGFTMRRWRIHGEASAQFRMEAAPPPGTAGQAEVPATSTRQLKAWTTQLTHSRHPGV